MIVFPQASQNFVERRFRKVIRVTAGIMTKKTSDGKPIAQVKPTKRMAVAIVNGGQTFRLSWAFFPRKKKTAENKPSTTHTPIKIGKTCSALLGDIAFSL
jgi:hypothetical protein